MPLAISALVFDHDGLLVNTEVVRFKLWQATYHAYGFSLTLEEWRGAAGYRNPQFALEAHLAKLLGGTVPKSEIAAKRSALKQDMDLRTAKLPGVENLLQEAQRERVRLAVASTGSQERITQQLREVGLLGYFDVVVTLESVLEPKPDPAVYFRALELLGLPAESVVALEDSEPGCRAAKGAGVGVVAIPNEVTIGQDLTMAELVVNSATELNLDILSRVPETMLRREFGLSTEQVLERYDNSISKRAFRKASAPAERSVLWVEIAQSAGGKTTAARQRARELADRGGSVRIDRDTTRANNPRLFRRVLERQLPLRVLDPEAELWDQLLILDTIKQNCNLVITSWLSRPTSLWYLPLVRPELAQKPEFVQEVGFVESLESLRKAGLGQQIGTVDKRQYWIGFDVIARNNLASYLSVWERYVNQMRNTGMARRTASPESHRKNYLPTPRMLEWAENLRLADRFIVRTHTACLYDSATDGVVGGASAALKKERDRPWTPNECREHIDRWLTVLRTLSQWMTESQGGPRAAIHADRLQTATRAARADVFRLLPREEGCARFPELSVAYTELLAAQDLGYVPPPLDSPRELIARWIENGGLAEARSVRRRMS